MDEVDLVIWRDLWTNSRVTIRELSDKLGISVNSVHKRMNNLVELGVIEGFFMMPIKLLPASIWVTLMGKSASPELERAILGLGEREEVFKVASFMDNRVMVTGYLRDVSDIGDFTEDTIRQLDLVEHSIGLIPMDNVPDGTVSFSKLDYRILVAMGDDPRRAISDVAKELGVSPKTVKRRLTRMEDEGTVHVRILWQPSMGDIIQSYMYITLSPGVTKQEVFADLANNYKPNLLASYEYPNLPDLVQAAFWTKTMSEVNEIHRRLQEGHRFKEVVPTVQSMAYHFDTWARDHVRKMAKGR
jgi:DNA-binding Lrp family transcriptional regulator